MAISSGYCDRVLYRAFERLEPYAVKVARTVLGGAKVSNGLGLPDISFTGRYRKIAKTRQHALDERYAQNPERFVKGAPRVARPPSSVAINPVVPDETGNIIDDRVNSPTLAAAGYVKSILFSK